MRVLLAHPRGFCAGVDMALSSLDRALELFGAPVYAYHQIVHNAPLVSRYERRGVRFVDDLGAVPEGATVVFSAHGVAPELRRAADERRLRVVDATCPLVHKVHNEARRFARAGYTIVFIGHGGHDETVGVMGEAPGLIHLVETVEGVASLEVPDPMRVAYLTQTTLSQDEARRIIDALRGRFPRIAAPPREDICYATQNRQEAVSELLADADLLLVIGSRNSSNSQRLAELGSSRGVPARLIDGTADLDPAWFRAVGTVLLTAGASVPEEFVEAVLEWIRARFDAEVEERRFAEETLRFQLPLVVRPAEPNVSAS
ncbi:MAG: 4-hydroxy-3-methylbut-2-enyl diphosphate reductase [Gemmatimonadota bacterium]